MLLVNYGRQNSLEVAASVNFCYLNNSYAMILIRSARFFIFRRKWTDGSMAHPRQAAARVSPLLPGALKRNLAIGPHKLHAFGCGRLGLLNSHKKPRSVINRLFGLAVESSSFGLRQVKLRGEVTGRHGAAEQVTLHFRAALVAEPVGLLLSFDALGNDGEAERVSEQQHRSNDRCILRTAAHGLHEAFVDLEPDQGKAFEHGKGSIAGAVIVDGDLDTIVPELAERRDDPFVMTEHDVLRDFEFQRARRQSGGMQGGTHLVDQVARTELRAEQVYSHTELGGAGVPPTRGL